MWENQNNSRIYRRKCLFYFSNYYISIYISHKLFPSEKRFLKAHEIGVFQSKKKTCKSLYVNINFLHIQNTCWIQSNKCNFYSKVFLLDIQVPFDNCARLPITHTTADVALFAQKRRRLAMFIHVCQFKISKLTLKCLTKTFYFVSACYTHLKRVTKSDHQVHLENNNLGRI